MHVLNFVTTRSSPSPFRLGFVYFFIDSSPQCDFCGSMAPSHTVSPTLSGTRPQVLAHNDCHRCFIENKRDRSAFRVGQRKILHISSRRGSPCVLTG
jgi:hypothetical protein